jgi:predicted nucleic acid-binding protein
VIVLDASAVLELLLDSKKGQRVRARISAEATLHAPHVLDLEVAQALRRFERTGDLGPERARGALQDLSEMPIERYPHDPLLPRIWALRRNATAYDAAYLALAEALEAPLLTSDGRLGSVPGHTVRVEVLK